jgi:hypothetical protein
MQAALEPVKRRAVGFAPRTLQPNSTCVPGHPTVFVATGGTFHPCGNHRGPATGIGHCGSGIDVDKAQGLLRAYARLCNRLCQGCWAWRLCSQCFIHSAGAGGWPSRSRKAVACRREKQRIMASLRRYIAFGRTSRSGTRRSMRGRRITADSPSSSRGV